MPSIIAAVTDMGRRRNTDLFINGRGFIINRFEFGNGGHDPANPTIALTPDVQLNALPGLQYGPADITSAEEVGLYCPQFNISVGLSVAVGEISNVGLIGTINYVPSGIAANPIIGTTFLFAIGNMPLRVKLASETLALSVTIQY